MLNIDFRPADPLISIAVRPAEEFEPERAFLSMVIEAVTIPVRSVTGQPVFCIRLTRRSRVGVCCSGKMQNGTMEMPVGTLWQLLIS